MKSIKEVMIVDDDTTLIFLAEKFTQITGMVEKTTAFEDGRTAYDELLLRLEKGSSLPDIILLDITMQDWDAWTMLTELKRLGLLQRLSIFIVTSSASKEDRLLAKSFNLEDQYIEKPISPELLRAIFESHLGA